MTLTSALLEAAAVEDSVGVAAKTDVKESNQEAEAADFFCSCCCCENVDWKSPFVVGVVVDLAAGAALVNDENQPATPVFSLDSSVDGAAGVFVEELLLVSYSMFCNCSASCRSFMS